MTFTTADLDSANAKLAAIDFTPAETEAVANFLSEAGEADEVTGFSFEPEQRKGFLLEVSGFMPGTKHFSPTGKYEAPIMPCTSPDGD